MLLSTVELTLLLLKTKNSLTRYIDVDNHYACDSGEDNKTLDFRCGGSEMNLSTWLRLFNGMGR